MEQKRLCPFCMGELPPAATVCPHCGKILEGCNPAGCLPVGTVLAGRYTVGEMRSLDGEGVLYSGVENLGAFRVTIKEYLPVTLSAERGADCILRPKQGSEVLFKTTRMDFADLYRAVQRITPASGLEAMHKAGLVHRGICPENIRVMSDGRCRLAGYATVGLRTAGSGLHEQLYEGYSAPEQYTTAEFEGRYTDEYSLAAVFYRMVCGQAPMPAAQRVVSDSNPRARTVEPAVPAYVSDVLQLGLRLKVMERIQTVPQLYQALSSKEYTAELTRTMKPETPMHPVRAEQSAQSREHLLSLKGLLAGILILLSVLILLTLWGIVSSKEEQTPSSEPSSEAASSEEMKPQNLVPNFVGIDYEQIKNNREYTSMYLFRAVLEYSDTVPSGQVIRQEPEAGEVMENGEVIQIVVSQGPEKVEMPKIIGASQDKAIEILSSRGLVASCFMVVNDGSYATGCVVSASEEEGAMVTVGTVITVYIAADPSVQITTTPEEPAATEPTTPETPPEGSTEPEYDTN